MNKKSIVIKPKPPFNFDLTAKVFSDEINLCMRDNEICKYSNGKYWRVLNANNKLIFIMIESTGDTNNPSLEVELISDKKISKGDEESVKDTISFMFNLNLDLIPFYKTMKCDPIISKLIKKLYGLKVTASPTVFEALVHVILEQQISLQAAYRIETRLIKKFGEIMKIDNKVFYAFPTPERLSVVENQDIRSCGVSQRKAEYICEIARQIVERKLDLEALKNKESEEIMKELCKIRGIGPWTAELTIIRGMNKFDVIPADDLGLRRHFSRYYFTGKGTVSSSQVREISEKWDKWKGLVGFYLVIAGRLGITL